MGANDLKTSLQIKMQELVSLAKKHIQSMEK